MGYAKAVAEAKARTNHTLQELKGLDIRRTWGKPRTRREEGAYLAGVAVFLVVLFLTVTVILIAGGVL